MSKNKNNEQELPLGLYWKDKRTTVDRIVLPFQSLEVIETITGGGHYNPHNPWKDVKKKERFIELLCKVEGKEYKQNKKVTDRKILISEVALVAKEVLGINVKVKL